LSGAEWKQALILFDLDGFKPINDTFGHPAGDALLIEVSQRLQGLDRGGSIARLGGDEFALLCDCADQASAMQVAKRAVEVISDPFIIGGRKMVISACAGVSVQTADELADAMLRADVALYSAKRSGRGKVAIFSNAMQQKFKRRTSIEQALRDPGLADSIDLAFQPIYDLGTMELRSFEALARWRHSELGWIPPSEFIPITEQISLLEDMSNALLRRAARAARRWPCKIRLSFNLSATQLCSPGTATDLLSIIADEGLPSTRLQIEVTETALLADLEVARQNLSQLRDEGVGIVLDDFGAGYSSISYLREMSFDTVKLDGSLISSITRLDSGLPLLRGVLALCQAMGQQCVAEHIETERELALLRRLGCRYGQGYLLSPPVDVEEALALTATAQEKQPRSLTA
jgi:diguanylate cyclase (GGDEF)-like protein